MTAYRTIAIPTAVADAVRETLEAPGYGHPASVGAARGSGPCRHCLRPFRPGEKERILFTYDPFEGLESLPLPGPIYVHATRCERYSEEGGFPEGLRMQPLTFNGYARGRRLIAQEYVNDGDVERMIDGLFARPDIDYIHVRSTAAGCYDLRIERAD